MIRTKLLRFGGGTTWVKHAFQRRSVSSLSPCWTTCCCQLQNRRQRHHATFTSVSKCNSLPIQSVDKLKQLTVPVRFYVSDNKSKNEQLRDSGSSNDKEDEKDLEETDDSPGILKRFKDTYKNYGKLLIAVHGVTSCVWLGAFYYAAMNGVDVVPILTKLGAGEAIIKPFQKSGIGNVAVAYLLYKLATPARYTVTIFGTRFAGRKLRAWGYMPEIPEGSSIRDLASEGREKLKQKRGEIRDDMKESRERARQKAEDIKDDFKEKVQEKIQQYKDKKS